MEDKDLKNQDLDTELEEENKEGQEEKLEGKNEEAEEEAAGGAECKDADSPECAKEGEGESEEAA